MTTGLFRREAIEGRLSPSLGRVYLVRPPSAAMLASASALAAIVVALILTFGTYTHRSRIVGHVVSSRGLVTVTSPVSGFVDEARAVEGRSVRAGSGLVKLRTPRQSGTGIDTIDALDKSLDIKKQNLVRSRAAEHQLVVIQMATARGQLASAQHEIALLRSSHKIATRQIAISKQALARLGELREQQYVSEVQVAQQESALLEKEASAKALEQQILVAEKRALELSQSVRELEASQATIEIAHSEKLRELTVQEIELAIDRSLWVSSPTAGVISAQLVHAGQQVQAGAPLYSVLPSGSELYAELFVPSRAIGFVKEQGQVLVRFQAFPYQKFGHQTGTIVGVSKSALSPDEFRAVSAGLAATEPMYRIRVKLPKQTVRAYGKEEALKPGMLLEADILGETRTLLEWLLEPIYAVSGKAVGG